MDIGSQPSSLQSGFLQIFQSRRGDEDHREEDLAMLIMITDILENNISNGQSDEILIKTRVD